MAERELPEPEDDTDRRILADVARVGWAVIAIEEDDEGPGFAFSVGIHHTLGQPEIFLMGLKPRIAMALINDIGAAMRAGRRFRAGRRYDGIADGFPLAFVRMAKRHYRDYLGYAGWFYRGPKFPVLQCVWPDKQGVFPWEEGYDGRFFSLQRLLGPAGGLTDGWVFPDPPSVRTFTVRQVVRKGKPILYVVHDDEDGDWQFLPGDPVKTADSLIVCLAEMVRHDPSLAELANLPPGWRAWRSAPGEPWQRERIEAGPPSP